MLITEVIVISQSVKTLSKMLLSNKPKLLVTFFGWKFNKMGWIFYEKDGNRRNKSLIFNEMIVTL